MVFFFEKIRSFYSNQLINLIKAETSECYSLLDLGCGYNISMKRITEGMDHSIGIDLHMPSIEKARNARTHSEIIAEDIISYLQNAKSKSFDVVIAMDLIEHFNKEDGLNLMKQMERVASKKVIINTPNGFVPQKPYDNNPWQEHKSGWDWKEMQAYGYKTWGFSGLKILRGERAVLKYKPEKLFKILSLLTQLYTHRNPKYSFSLLCIKTIK